MSCPAPTMPPLLLLGLCAACGEPPDRACNGAELLCQRPYDQVSTPCTHNAMSNTEDRWVAPNQGRNMGHQLQDGVRAMMLDLYRWNNKVSLCHTMCGLGNRELREALAELRRFLEDNPRQVLTLILESYVPARDLAADLEAEGLLAHLHRQPQGQAWPTLGTMISDGRRLVIFGDKDPAYPWLHPIWDHAWETDWSNKRPADLDCARNRGKSTNPLFILNHFIADPLPSPQLAAQINTNPFFIQRAARCQKESGSLPNFVTVDFYDVGDLLQVTRTLNGL